MPVIGDNIIGVETWNNNKTISQVYQATHDGVGNSLPYMSRSFISFTFGGKDIEDFGLIVVIDGDRMERDAYASFSDLTGCARPVRESACVPGFGRRSCRPPDGFR